MTSHSVHFSVLKEWKKKIDTGHFNELYAEPAAVYPGSCRWQVHDHRVPMQAFTLYTDTVYRSPVMLSSVNGDRVPKAHFSFLWTQSPVK